MLGMQDEAEKGFHPYKFTDIAYVGNMTSKKFFDLDNVSESEHEKFKTWCTEKQKYILFQQCGCFEEMLVEN